MLGRALARSRISSRVDRQPRYHPLDSSSQITANSLEGHANRLRSRLPGLGCDATQHLSAQTELREILDRTVQALPPIFRTVFVLRDLDHLSTEETAEALNISVPAVKSRLLRARLQLREDLTRYFKRGNKRPDQRDDGPEKKLAARQGERPEERPGERNVR